jgi:GntR family transcriptional regulator/MocR family aminotransferase
MGFLVVPEHLVEPIITIKSLANYGHPWFDQIVMAEFIEGGAYRRHLRSIRRLYQCARDTLVGSLDHHFGAQQISGEYAGMHLMWTLPPALGSAQKFAALAASQDVGIYPLDSVGAIDFGGGRQANSIVLGYSSLSSEQIETGIARLAHALREGTIHRIADWPVPPVTHGGAIIAPSHR